MNNLTESKNVNLLTIITRYINVFNFNENTFLIIYLLRNRI